MKRKYLYGIVAAAVFCVLAFGLWHLWQSSLPETAEGSKTVTVEVTHADGSTVAFTYQTDLEYLGELLQQEGLISGSAGDYGLFVETVDGESVDYAKNQSWWRLTCNGEDAATGADAAILHDGDHYGWFYTAG